MLQIVASLTDDTRSIIYNCNIFPMQATDYRIEDLNLAVTRTGRKITEEKQKKICNMDWTKLYKKTIWIDCKG
jgi:hypothetical protein